MKLNMFWAWLSTFVVVTIIDIVWHVALFGSFYTAQLTKAGIYDASGMLAPLIPYKILSNVVLAIVFVCFIPQMGGDNSYGMLAKRGMALSGLFILYLGLVNHAVVDGWTMQVAAVDTIFGILIGLVSAYIIGYFVKKTMASMPPKM